MTGLGGSIGERGCGGGVRFGFGGAKESGGAIGGALDKGGREAREDEGRGMHNDSFTIRGGGEAEMRRRARPE